MTTSVPDGAIAIWMRAEEIEGSRFYLWNVYRFDRWLDRDDVERTGWRRIDRDLDGSWTAGHTSYDRAAAVAAREARR